MDTDGKALGMWIPVLSVFVIIDLRQKDMGQEWEEGNAGRAERVSRYIRGNEDL